MRIALILAVAGLALAGKAFAAGWDMLPAFPTLSGASVAVTTTGAAVDVRDFSSIGLQFNESGIGATAAGTFFVDTSLDYIQGPAGSVVNAGNWVPYTFTTAPTVSGPASSVLYREISQSVASWIRVRYVPTATGAGVATVFISGK